MNKQNLLPGDRLARLLVLLWVVSLVILVPGLLTGIRDLQITGVILGCVYVLVLSWYLIAHKPGTQTIPDFQPVIRFFSGNTAMLAFLLTLTIGVTLLACFLLRDGWLLLLVSIPFSLVFIIFWRKRLKRRMLLTGFALLVLLAFVENILGADNSSGLILPFGVTLMFLAGVLLVNHTGLAHIRLLEGEYLEAGKSFLWGCLLALPPALLNVITIQWAPVSDFDLLFDRWWEPLYALQPAIIEEIWARLLLVTLVYTLLRPTSGNRSTGALFWAIGIAAFLHGMAHVPGSITDPGEGILITLVYGVPLGLLYVKRDLEQAIAYHFFIDLVRFAAFVIWNL